MSMQTGVECVPFNVMPRTYTEKKMLGLEIWIPREHLPSPLPPLHPWQWLAMRKRRFTVQPCSVASLRAVIPWVQPAAPESFEESLLKCPRASRRTSQIKNRHLPGDKLPGPRGSPQCLPRDKSRLLGLYWLLPLRWYHKGEQGHGLSARPRCRTSNRRCGGGWLTRPAGRSQLQHVPASLLPSLRQCFNNFFINFFLLWLLGLCFLYCKDGEHGEHRTRIALLHACCTGSKALRRWQVLIWVIKFSRINARGVPPYKIMPLI